MKDHYWQERGIAYRTNTFDCARQTLVFIHGIGAASSAWAFWEEVLERNYNILTYDLRGHGLSRRFQTYDDYAPERLVDDLHALLSFLKIQSCTLISTSFGTLIALLFMHRHSGIVQTNMLLAPIYKAPPPNVATANFRPPLLLRVLSRIPFSCLHGKRMDYSVFKYAKDLQWGRIVPEIRNMSLRIYLFYLHHLCAFTDYETWAQIEVPTTIIHGTKDSFSPFNSAVEISKIIPSARLVTLEGGNHLIINNNANEVLAELGRDLTQVR